MTISPAPRPSRRAVLGAAAWSVPAIAVATAAPAYAISSAQVPHQLVVSSATTAWEAVWNLSGLLGYYLRFTIVVHNDSEVTTTGLQVSITFPAEYGAVRTSTLGGGVGAGWSNGAVSNRVFTTTRNSQLAPHTSASLLTQGRIFVPSNPPGAGPGITISATDTGTITGGVAVVTPS